MGVVAGMIENIRRIMVAIVAATTLAMTPGGPALAQTGSGRSQIGQRMTEMQMDRSLAALVAEGWQIAAVSQSGPVFAYHLVHEGALAICYFNLAEQPPNSLCYRMAPAR